MNSKVTALLLGYLLTGSELIPNFMAVSDIPLASVCWLSPSCLMSGASLAMSLSPGPPASDAFFGLAG